MACTQTGGSNINISSSTSLAGLCESLFYSFCTL